MDTRAWRRQLKLDQGLAYMNQQVEVSGEDNLDLNEELSVQLGNDTNIDKKGMTHI